MISTRPAQGPVALFVNAFFAAFAVWALAFLILAVGVERAAGLAALWAMLPAATAGLVSVPFLVSRRRVPILTFDGAVLIEHGALFRRGHSLDEIQRARSTVETHLGETWTNLRVYLRGRRPIDVFLLEDAGVIAAAIDEAKRRAGGPPPGV